MNPRVIHELGRDRVVLTRYEGDAQDADELGSAAPWFALFVERTKIDATGLAYWAPVAESIDRTKTLESALVALAEPIASAAFRAGVERIDHLRALHVPRPGGHAAVDNTPAWRAGVGDLRAAGLVRPDAVELSALGRRVADIIAALFDGGVRFSLVDLPKGSAR